MTDAERLIDIANAVLYPRDQLLLSESIPPRMNEVVALALRLKTRPDLALRAMMEEWTRVRIVRELY